LMRALRQGQTLGMLPDQVPPAGMGEWLPFFGRPAYTMTLAARLATQTGATVVLAWGERLPWGRGFRIHLRGLAEPLPQDPVLATARLNHEMERIILECPQQYLWGYARYKPARDGA
ncbi:MAG: lysophospholipid acyltransferase family protein, partial [Burkholderiaceae bacterium]|nr:lysophospholipid acyltransferase family protein [Burkholderiaceae bacterium]